ncbi:hypothetical protein BC835DRAFT_1305493 [Cytidiella melzeri]|nr:hypothetical protein BC835DRAFT_1305493 [Cytidiella melzeri]
MKRGAENQLTRDDSDEEEVADGEPAKGFKKADATVIAKRPLTTLCWKDARAAPTFCCCISCTSTTVNPFSLSHTGGASLSLIYYMNNAQYVFAPQPEPPAAPKFAGFGGFSGFGSSVASTTPFAFTASTTPTKTVSTPPSSAFSAVTSSFPPANPVSITSAPVSNATKLFASVVDASSKPEPSIQNGHHTRLDDDERVKVETKYYTALRGLNVSFLAACKKAVDSDPYTNIADIMERYNVLRSGVKSDYEGSLKKLSSPTPAAVAKIESKAPPPPASSGGFGGSSSSSNSTTASNSQSKSSLAMPAPPSTFSGFNFPPVAAAAPSSEGGFKPQLASPPPGNKSFPFGDKPADKPADSSLSSTAVKSPFTFGAPTSSSSSSSGDKAAEKTTDLGSSSTSTKSAFAFGAPTSSTLQAFGGSASKDGGGAYGATPSVFSSSLFSAPSDDTKDKQNGKASSLPAFGSMSSSNPFSGTAAVGGTSSDKSSSGLSSPFTFGASSTRQTFGFGKTGSGSIGNPVGFGFGSPPKTPDAVSAPQSTSSAFSFGAPKVGDVTDRESEGSEDTLGQGTPDEAPPMLITNTVHDQDGEGEEDENTAHEQKSKVYKMIKKDDGTQEWKDMGVGLLKVKVHKETDARRLLLRNSSTGKILINFNIHAGMNPSAAKNVVSFMGHENGVSLPYKIRVKTNEQADELRRTLDEEVAKVKTKPS